MDSLTNNTLSVCSICKHWNVQAKHYVDCNTGKVYGVPHDEDYFWCETCGDHRLTKYLIEIEFKSEEEIIAYKVSWKIEQ